jgi:hypothetical protein
MEAYVARRQVRSPDPIEHGAECHVPDLLSRLPECRQGHRQQPRILDIVDADEPNVVRYPVPELDEGLHGERRRAIVGAHQTVGLSPVHEVRDGRSIGRIQASD